MNELLEDRESWARSACSVAAALDIVGTRSAMLVLREAFLGTRRFDDFARRVGIGEPAAAARLKELTDAGILERVPYREPGQRTRSEYQLTPKGRDLLPVVTALRAWGDAWAVEAPAIEARHIGCGATVRAVVRCDAGHDIQPGEVGIAPGPGLVRD